MARLHLPRTATLLGLGAILAGPASSRLEADVTVPAPKQQAAASGPTAASTPTPAAASSNPPPATEQAKPDPLEPMRQELAKLQLERDRAAAELALKQTALELKLSDTKTRIAEMQTRLDELKTRLEMAEMERREAADKELTDLRRKSERLVLESTVAKAESDIEGFEMRHEENVVKRKTNQIALQIELQQKEAESRTYAEGKQPQYLNEPLEGRKLIISDRRVALNGVVTTRTADDIAERINYFNNRDPKAPIFIVIDDCPGGSVMAGYKIMKAMHGSQAPVYVVVKSFAASLAACITTCAEKSFAYPNAIILHHQLSAFGGGNLTQHRETVAELEEWWRRLADPIAAKMGISRDEFIKRMYAESSTGDWNEFADDAQKLKWVDVIVDDIEETSLLRHPDTQPAGQSSGLRPTAPAPGHLEDVVAGTDERGRPAALLPRLNPLDAYWLYNPDGYYRMQ